LLKSEYIIKKESIMAKTNKNQMFSSGMITNVLLAILVFFLLINTCTNMSVSRKVDKLPAKMYTHDSTIIEKIKTIDLKNRKILREEFDIDVNQALYNFLIYESDLDRKKISLSEIKDLLIKDEKNIKDNENNTK